MSGLSLHSFLVANRDEVLERSRSKLSGRQVSPPGVPNAAGGLALFLDQLITVLGPTPEDFGADRSGVTAGAALHGEDLLRQGLTVAQVVQDYGSICQGVTEVASERHAAITADEFKLFNQCLDEA
ncbi:MAG TPA: sensor histidine kinase, partial [Polyangia bacterium]|nr:sensor histidine kinase [Polyangia bacterium]